MRSGSILLISNKTWEWNHVPANKSVSNSSVAVVEAKQRPQEHPNSRRVLPPSSLWLYFGQHESGLRCPSGTLNVTYGTIGGKKLVQCGQPRRGQQFRNKKLRTRPAMVAATIEWLFQSVNTIVIEEAERQITEEAFANDEQQQRVPESLITVNIRWGDKWREMKLVSIEEYLDATKKLLTDDELKGKETVHIYLASEDPRAMQLYTDSAPDNWIIHSSGPTQSNVTGENMRTLAKFSDGRAGLESLAALLIAMEANRYVLTTGSNWSRLINELRKNVVNPRCGECTSLAEFVDPKRSFT